MQIKTIHIKNMVCPRCIDTVESIFNVMELEISSITLGEVITEQEISKHQKEKLDKKLSERGFELLEDNKSKLIGKIKTLIINSIHYSKEPIYITIEKFVLSQKIEKVKELIFYDELTLSEIAFQMDYSSVAYLSSQFKKETGMTPTQFKKLKKPGHNHLDSL